MGSVAHYSIMFVNAEAIAEVNRKHNDEEAQPTPEGKDPIEWEGVECLTEGSYPFILQHSKYGLPHLIGNVVITGVNFPDTVSYFNGALRLAQQQLYKGFVFFPGQPWRDPCMGLRDELQRGYGVDFGGNLVAQVVHLGPPIERMRQRGGSAIPADMAQIINWLRVPSGQDPRHERPPRDGDEYLAPSLS